MADNDKAKLLAERASLLRTVEQLDPRDWDTPSLAVGWRVRDVVAHVNFNVTLGLGTAIVGMLKARGDIHRFMATHARKVGDMLFLSGVGPRQPGTNAIPGGPIHDDNGEPLDYDIKAQTHAVVNNVRRIVEEAGATMDQVVDVTTFLVDMKRDFAGYNEVWAETLGKVGPTRTTLAIDALPTPIAVEMKVIVHLAE